MASVNKSKLVASAQKHLSKGSLDKALKDYQKILKSDAHDTSVRLKVGDLYDRLGDRAQAMAEYRRVATTFTSQGFYSKAIAVLKRIQSADPELVEIHLELAELNEKMGLLSEVVHHYQLAANVFDRRGEKRQAIDILKKVSEVGPPNLERRVKVAELYYKEGFPDAAYQQFIAATAELDERSPELLEVVKRMCKANPEDPKLALRLGGLHLAHGEPKLAVSVLEEARATEETPESLELLGEAKLHLELLGEARVLFEKAAQLYSERDEAGKARDLASRITEISEVLLEGPDALLSHEGAQEVETAREAEPAPEAETAPAPGVREDSEQADQESPGPAEDDDEEAPEETAAGEADPGTEDPAQAYEVEIATKEEEPPDEADDLSEDERLEVAFSEAEVYRKYGKLEGAVRILEKVADRFPDRHEPRVRLKEIYEIVENWAKVADQCRRLSAIASSRGDEFRASRFLQEARDALARLSGAAVEAPAPEEADSSTEAPREERPEEVAEPARPVAAAPAEEKTLDIRIDDEGVIGEWRSAEPAAAEIEPEPEPPPDPTAAIEDMLIRSDAFENAEEEAAGPVDGEPCQAEGDAGLDDLEILIDDEGANPEGVPLTSGNGESPEADLAAPSTGESDEADENEEEEPPAPELGEAGAEPLSSEPAEPERDAVPEELAIELDDLVLTEMDAATEEALAEAEPAEEEGAEAVPAEEEEEEEAEPAAEEGFPEEGLAEAYLAEEAPAEEALAEEAPVDPVVAEPAMEMPADALPEIEEDEEEVYVLDEPEIEEGEPAAWDWGTTDGRLSTPDKPGPDDAPVDESNYPTFDLRAELEEDREAEDEIGDVSDATEALSELVGELQNLEKEEADSFDSQTHYDLGIAYKEMTLHDEAIRELTLAARDPARRIECSAVLSICYREQGKPEEAVRMLEECLGDGSIATEQAPGLLYEMALAREEMGDLAKALDCYERLAGIDPGFEDVQARISSLRSAGIGDTEDNEA